MSNKKTKEERLIDRALNCVPPSEGTDRESSSSLDKSSALLSEKDVRRTSGRVDDADKYRSLSGLDIEGAKKKQERKEKKRKVREIWENHAKNRTKS